VDLSTTAARFKLPYYVIQGRHDLFAPTQLVEAYFNKVSAPKKRLIIIEDAGHFALATHQAEVIAALKAVISKQALGPHDEEATNSSAQRSAVRAKPAVAHNSIASS
jgi:fermentation-respiration switch protein FrsA (DUF1100 family)